MSTMAVWIGMAFLLSAPLAAQSSFEAASVKPHDPKTAFSKGRILPSGGLEIAGMTVENLLTYAYGVLPEMISGLPRWARETSYDVIAKAGHDTPPAALRLMLQALLAQRFQLASHSENKPIAAYVLTVGTHAGKLTPGAGTQPHCSWIALPAGVSRRQCENMSMAELARQLPGLGHIGVDRPVVDQTGLAGTWNFQLDVRLAPPSSGAALPQPDAAIPEGPTIFDAFEQIGLRLEPRKVSLPVLVVDRIGQLTEN
ncbi:MAG TPA: TIGR03435 family protein [Bryobacteraceae bacterium]|nr:TIGR03435 family protein [Bryobacteraceae bacterium]